MKVLPMLVIYFSQYVAVETKHVSKDKKATCRIEEKKTAKVAK